MRFSKFHFIEKTSICAIYVEAFSYCNLTCGTNTKETFNAYFKYLLNHYEQLNKRVVFWCDNCKIHNDIETIVEGTKHVVVFNAAYSPELNPIENIFGIWKERAERNVREWNGIQDFINKIVESFKSIEPNTFVRKFEHVRGDVWKKVFDKEDL